MFQISAREIFTLETKFCLFFLKYFTVLDFTSYASNGFIDIRSSATGTLISLS